MYTAKQALADAEKAISKGNELANVLTVIAAAARAGRLSIVMNTNDVDLLAELEAAGYEVEKQGANRYEVAWRVA